MSLLNSVLTKHTERTGFCVADLLIYRTELTFVRAEGNGVDSADAAAVARHIPRAVASSPVEVGF